MDHDVHRSPKHIFCGKAAQIDLLYSLLIRWLCALAHWGQYKHLSYHCIPREVVRKTEESVRINLPSCHT